MKYINFKRYKFGSLLKNLNLRKYSFTRIFNNIDLSKYNFSKLYRYIGPSKYNFSKLYRYIGPSKYNFSKLYRYISPSKYNFSKLYKIFKFKKNKYILFHIPGFLIFLLITYLIMPTFYNYEKIKFTNFLCKDLKLECSINGKIKYSFFPTPRIKIKDIIVADFINKKKTLGRIESAEIKISFFNLLNKEKQKFTKIQFDKANINLNLNNLKIYKNFFKDRFHTKSIKIKEGKISFFENSEYITEVQNINFRYKPGVTKDKFILKGKFLGDTLNVNLKNIKKNEKPLKILTLKLSALKIFSKIEIYESNSDSNSLYGNALFKKGENRLTTTFDYKNNEIILKKSNLRNAFLDGKFSGKVVFLPYFNFNLDFNLKNVNFNKFHKLILNLNEESLKKLFKIDKKINGQLSVSANKIISKNNFVDSIESRINLINGDILVDQLLLNFGKIGAADISGVVKNDEKYSNFKFENNIFIDNLKKFNSKFKLYNKKNISLNLFSSGMLDLINLQLRLNEVSDEEKFAAADMEFIEKEFNEIVLIDGYKSFFDFYKIKEFVKIVLNEDD